MKGMHTTRIGQTIFLDHWIFLPALNMVNNKILNLSVIAVIIVFESFSLVNKIDFGFHDRIYFFCPPKSDIIS